MEQHELFEKHRPELQDAETENTIHFEGLTVSFAARRATDVLVLKFATEARPYRSIVLSKYAAEMLRQALAQNGF